MRKGVPLAPGIAIAPAYCLEPEPRGSLLQPLEATALAAEVGRFERARTAAAAELDARMADVAEQLGREETAIFQAHRSLIDDPTLIHKVKTAISDRRVDSRTALRNVLAEYGVLLAQINDEYLKRRLADLRCVVEFIGRHLDQPSNGDVPPARSIPDGPVILVASEILPSHLLLSQQLQLAGIVTETGAGTGHAAILARSLGIPTVSGLPRILGEIQTGDVVGRSMAAKDTSTSIRISRSKPLSADCRPRRRTGGIGSSRTVTKSR